MPHLSEHTDKAVRAQLAAHPKATGLHVAAVVMDALTDGDQLLLGASNPVRDAALVSYPAPKHPGAVQPRCRGHRRHRVDGGRGRARLRRRAARSRCWATSPSCTTRPACSSGPAEPRPRDLTIVVANDDGGGIFELLEQGDPQYAGVFERVFGTPHGMDLAALCAAYRVEHHAWTWGAVDAAGRTEPPGDRGIRVLEVATERSGLRELHAAVRAQL